MSLRELLAIAIVFVLTGCGGSSGMDQTAAMADSYDFANKGIVMVPVSNGVLANDTGDGLIATLTITPQISEGFEFNNDGSFSYNAEAAELFTDQFEYQITDNDGLTQTARVTINVFPKPVAVKDDYRVNAGEDNVVPKDNGVLVNDELYRIASIAVLLDGPVQAASFELSRDGSFTYTPAENANGVDSFSYSVQDDLQTGDEQIVELVIDSGVFKGEPDSFSVVSGRILKLQPLDGLLKNDDGVSDVNVVVQKHPLHAIDFSVSAAGLLVYRTISETALNDSFSYTLHKNKEVIGPFDVSIGIEQPSNDALLPGLYDQCKEYQSGKIVNGVLSGVGIEGATFELISEPRFGTLTAFDGASGQYSYTRLTTNRGQDAFSFRLFDANGNYVADASQELIAVPYRIMPVGDSITSGVEFYDAEINADTPISRNRVGYRKFLKDELSAQGYSIDLVGSRNEGYSISGFTDSQHNGFPGVSDEFISNNIEQWLNTTGADIVLMHIGTNATKSHTNHIESIATKLESWEEREDNPVTWMMAKLIARIDNTSSANSLKNFNGLIEGFVSDRMTAGDRIHLVDQYQALEAGNYMSADKLHPRIEGYQKMSQEWIKRLQETRAISKCY